MSSKPNRAMRYFALPALATLALLTWWGYAMVVPQHFQTPGRNSGSAGNAVGFNLVLLIAVGLAWLGAVALYVHNGSDE